MTLKQIYFKLVGFRTRPNYWSCSKFSDFLRRLFKMDVKPKALTMERWKEYNQLVSKQSPIGDFIINELLDIIQDIVNFPLDVYYNFKAYFYNRFVHKLHFLQTGLNPGQYYDLDTRILNGIMNEIVSFVEKDKARSQRTWKHDKTCSSNREAGLKYLDWEISLLDEIPHQAKTAQEVKNVYLWWKDIRPLRDVDSKWEHVDLEDEEKRKSHYEKMEKLEKKYYDEDTEMLVRVMKIRNCLWD